MSKANYSISVSASTRDAVQNSIGLLVSILVRYPEVATCKLSPADGCIRFTYILRGSIDQEVKETFSSFLTTSIAAFHHLQSISVNESTLNFAEYGQFSLLEVKRDFSSLTRQEIALISTLVAIHFKDRLVLEDYSSWGEEELDVQDEIIENMLEDTRFEIVPKDLIGFRENGRVLVYNKTS